MIRKVLILIIFAMFITQASSESGNLLIDIGTTNSYTITVQFSENPVTTIFLFDSTNYNKVSDWQLSPTTWTYPKQADSTTFTITSGGTGFGTISYQKNLNTINWYCNDYCTITASSFTVTYDSDIFSGFSFGGDRSTSVSSSQPLFMQGVDAAKAVAGAYVVNTHKTVQNNYSITYTGNLFNTSIDKSGATVSTKIYIDNSTMNRFKEAAFTTNSFNYVLPYDSGIILRMQTSDGFWDNVTVNSTGAPGQPSVAPGTNPVNITKPNTGANIAFDKTSYFIGDNANMSWYYSDSVWNDFLTSKKINLKINGEYRRNPVSLELVDLFDVGSQTGYKIIEADTVGTLTGVAQKCTLFVLCDEIGSQTVTVNPPGTSWIALSNNTQNVFGYTTVTYHIGYSTASYVPGTIVIQVVDKSTGNLADVAVPSVFPDGNVTICGSSLSTRVCQEGVYSVELKDALKGILDKKTLTVIRVPDQINTLGILVSNVTTDKTYYFIYDFMTVNYQVDDANFTNYSIRGEIYNNNKSFTTKYFYSIFSNQTGQFDTNINNNPAQICEQQKNCWVDIGYNSFRLVAYNSTNSFVIAQYNFTVASTTADGYGLILSTTRPSVGQTFSVKTIVPTGHTGRLRIADAGIANIISVINQTVNEGTNTLPVSIRRVNPQGFGYYDVILYGDDGFIKVKIPITVTNSTSSVATAPTTGTIAITNWSSNILSLFSTMFFWGLMLLLGFAITVYRGKFPVKTRPDLAIVVFAFIENIVGLFAPYTIPIFVIIVIIITLMFRKGKEVIGEE